MNHRARKVFVASLLVACLVAWLAPAPALAQTGDGKPAAGNYCIGCHSVQDERLERAGEWRGSVATASPGACPALRAVDEQRYYVERQLLANSRLDASGAAPLDERYARLLDLPLTSVDVFEAEAQALGYAGGKTYAALSASVENGKRVRVLIAALLVTAFLLFAFGWGLRNTLKAQPAKFAGVWRPGPRTLALLGLVLILFALPLFRASPTVDATSSAEEQAAQAELDKSSRAAAVAERALARAAVLGEIAAAWAPIDRSRGEAILAEALAAEQAARGEADALWGRSQAAEEAAVGSAATRDKAALVSGELLAVRNRVWGLRAIAEYWAAVDPKRAGAILAEAEGVARSNKTVYGEMDLRAIAAASKRIAPSHVVDLPLQPAPSPIESTDAAEAEALSFYAFADYEKAWEAASRIEDEWDRARSQAAIAAAWSNADAARAISVPALRDHALRRIAAAKGDAALAASIVLPYERVSALSAVGQPREAAAFAGELTEKSPLVQVIATLAPTQPEEASALVDQLDRESDKAEALRALAAATGDPALFDRALAMSAAARMRGDALAPARASLALARAFADRPGGEQKALAALGQAYELASQVSVKYK